MSISAAATSRLFGRLKNESGLIAQLFIGATGFVMSGASIMLACAPFGVAWAGAVQPQHSLAAALGSALGYLVLMANGGALRYMACLLLLLALRWSFSFIPASRIHFYTPLFAAAAVAATGVAIAMSAVGAAYDLVMAFCESAITATSGILFGRAERAVREGACFARSNGVCTGILLCALYMGLGAMSFGRISPAFVLAFAAMLCCGCFGGSGISCAVAVAAGLSAALSGSPELLAVFCAGGLCAGIFSPLGRVGVGAAASISALLACVAQSGFESIGPLFIECMAACVLLIIAPASLLHRFGLSRATDWAEGEMLRCVVISQLARTKKALADISQLTNEISQKLSEAGGDPIESVAARSCAQVCKSCKSSPRCWQNGYNITADAINHAFAAAKNGRPADERDLPAHFECERKAAMLSAINSRTEGYLRRRIKRRQMSQLRFISSDQFGGMGELLGALERRVGGYTCASAQTADAVTKYMQSNGGAPESVCCYLDGSGHLNILAELPAHKAARFKSAKAAEELSELTAQELSKPECVYDGGFARLFWSARTRFKIESAFLQHSAENNRFCGDSLKVIEQTDSRAALLLSDGMGVGSPAAVDSEITTSLLEKLLIAGSDFDSALRLVNSALLSGGGEERLCTVDAAIIDLHSCRLDIFKAGAAPSFVIRRGRCIKVEAASLPAGILSGAEAKHTSLSLSEGDIIVMLSDGITESGSDWIPSQLIQLEKLPLEELCSALMQTAHDRRLSPHEDDMTVIAARIEAA